MVGGETPIVFLAMFWGGGGPYTISELINVYDWINRDIVSRADLERALNELLMLELIQVKDNAYLVPRTVGMDFDTYRKKKRKGRFQIARMYFEQFDLPRRAPRTVRLTEARYASELKKYRDSF
jgi:hypothetical protein